MSKSKKYLYSGIIMLTSFAIWTILVKYVDVALVNNTNSYIGLSTINLFISDLIGFNYALYLITDYLGIIPILICFYFAILGLIQLIKRKSILKVDYDLIILGLYYIVVVCIFVIFELLPINFRPFLIEGRLEASYPSSTTLLVLTVMMTFIYRVKLLFKNKSLIKFVNIITVLYIIFMVCCRFLSGVHWFSDIIASIILSFGLYYLFMAANYLFLKQ